ncbi:uncharacterized protein LOC124816077 [Hydra vulgaris]|uniref:uncharacterized protein LOC124816077 n=1 Tax=Hydra vulgaris TaxID=6087 RepID=UPI001F5F9885|nr:uncharacterized protein LOC124816077 [Hydra vulgaris]
MACQKNGVHQRIKEKNNLAIFFNYDNHRLNLVGVHAVEEAIMSEREVNDSIKEGNQICNEWGVKFERRQRRKKRMDGEMSRDVGLTPKEEMERIIKRTVDRLFNELKTRSIRLMEIDEKFEFLLDVEGLCFNTEINHLKDQFQYEDKNVFPSMRIAFHMLLTLAVSVASCERSFSKLKLISSYLRASMGQSRLCDLALLSIEREITEESDFDNVIKKFAAIKNRKINL